MSSSRKTFVSSVHARPKEPRWFRCDSASKSTTSDGRTIYGEPKPRLITEPRFMLRALDASEVDVSAVREKDELKLQPDAQAFIDKDDTIAMASTLWRSL